MRHTKNQLAAIARDTLIMTRGHGLIMDLSGPRNRQVRRALMERLTGKHLPLAKCGVNALEDEFKDVYSILAGGTIRKQETRLSNELTWWAARTGYTFSGANQ